MKKTDGIEEILNKLVSKLFEAEQLAFKSCTLSEEAKEIALAQATLAIKEYYLGLLSKEENENDICQFGDDHAYNISIKDNVIWCNVCNKQSGYKLYNAAIQEMKERIK